VRLTSGRPLREKNSAGTRLKLVDGYVDVH
jgi:hypothetical protein